MPFSKGDPNINRKGRIDGGGGLKAYDRKKFIAMTDKQKDSFLADVSKEVRYKMAEGNPMNEIGGKDGKNLVIEISTESAERYDITPKSEDSSTG